MPDVYNKYGLFICNDKRHQELFLSNGDVVRISF
jgi:hypothetical protein